MRWSRLSSLLRRQLDRIVHPRLTEILVEVPIFFSVPVRLAPSVSEFAPALEPARCTEVLAWPLLLLAEGSSCSTRQRRCIASTVDRLLPAQASHHAARRRHADGSAYQRERAYAASHYVLWCLATDLGFVR
jgi:hypothetical protein